MARVKTVHNSRKTHICGRTGHEIPKGDSYFTASPGYHSRPKYRCTQHPFRPSELTTSLASEPMAAVEEFEDQAEAGFDDIDELRSAWEELGQAIEDYQSQRQEALDAWEYGNSQLEDFVYTADAAYDEWSSFEPEDFDEEPDREDFESQEEYESALSEWEVQKEEHLEQQTEEALNIATGLEF